MKARIQSFIRSDFATSSFYSAISNVIKFGTMLLMSKIIATYLGKEGLGLIGQLSSFVTIALVAAGGCINIGVIKYVSDYNANDPHKLNAFFRTGLLTMLSLGAVCSLVLIAFSGFWARIILVNEDYADVFVLFGITIICYGLNTYYTSVINGLKQYRLLNIINMITSISGLILSYVLTVNFHTRGAFYAIITNQSIIFFVTWLIARRQRLLGSIDLKLGIDREQLRLLSRFILMTVISTAFVPVVQLILRDYVIHNIGLSYAGIWESILRISNVHLLFITTTLSTYYLPRLSEIKEQHELRHEIWKMLKIVMPLVLFSSLTIFLLRYWVIGVLFTDEFREAGTLLGWQLLGDVLKTAAWIIGYQMHARAMTRVFIASEILGGLSYLGISILFIRYNGLLGASMAYAVNYFIYLLALLLVFNKVLFARQK